MGSDKGVLARAVAGGFKGGTEALRQTDILKEKFAWGDDVARRERETNLARFGQEKELVQHTADVGRAAARKQRGEVRGEAIQSEMDKVNVFVKTGQINPAMEEQATEMIKAGFPAASLIPQKKELTIKDFKALAEGVRESLGEDADPAEVKEMLSTYWLHFQKGDPGKLNTYLNTIATDLEAGQAKLGDRQATDAANKLLTSRGEGREQLTADFRALVQTNPEMAQSVYNKLAGSERLRGADLNELKRLLVDSSGKSVGVLDIPKTPAGAVGGAVGTLAKETVNLPRNIMNWNRIAGEWVAEQAGEVGRGVMGGFKR